MSYPNTSRMGDVVLFFLALFLITFLVHSCQKDMEVEGAKRATNRERLICDEKVVVEDNYIWYGFRSGQYSWYTGNETGLERPEPPLNTYTPVPGSRCAVEPIVR